MFSWQHIVWLLIDAILITASIILYKKHRPSFNKVLNYCLIVCFLSETTKVFGTIRLVPSADGSMMFPYIPNNHLPLHLCSIQILLILYVRFSSNTKMRETILSFMYPSCLLGSLMALAMPSIFTTSITVDQAFTSPMAYQFFIYHAMLFALGIIIAISNEIDWKWKHYGYSMITIITLTFISLYVNSLLAAPTYLNGELQHVDFWPNFFFSYNNPFNIKYTKLWHWYLYLLIIFAVCAILMFICYLIVIRKEKKEKK